MQKMKKMKIVTKTKTSNKSRSGYEEKIRRDLQLKGVSFLHEPIKIEYIQPAIRRYYIPDFITEQGIVVEAKGIFDLEDRKKHLYIKENYPELEVRFVFQRDQPIRKGSKVRYSDWCKANGFKYAIGRIPKDWFK